jgi:hypothetical protein
LRWQSLGIKSSNRLSAITNRRGVMKTNLLCWRFVELSCSRGSWVHRLP